MSFILILICVLLFCTIGLYILGIPWFIVDYIRDKTLGDTLFSFIDVWFRGLFTLWFIAIIGFLSLVIYVFVNKLY